MNTWLWRTGGLAFLGLLHSERKFSLDYHSQGTAGRADGHTPLVFLRKRPICLSCNFSLRGRFQGWYILVDYGAALKEHRLGTPSWWSPSALSSFLVSPRKELKHSSGAHTVDTSESWLWWPMGLILEAPQDYIYLHILKAAA